MTGDRSIEQIHADFMFSRAVEIASRLRGMAEEIDRHANDIKLIGTPGHPMYGSIASRVQHALLWGLANLSADALTTDASEADIARAKGE